MRRRGFLAAGGGVAAAGIAGCLGAPTPPASPTPAPPGLVNPSFEDGLAGWTADHDLPEDPNRPGSLVDNNTGLSDRYAADGEYSISFSIDGVADDGTLWVQQPVDLTGYSTLIVDVFSPEESFNSLSRVAAYAGPRRSRLVEADFDTTHAFEERAGWRSIEYPVTGVKDGLVAVGMSVVWETRVTRWLDDVRLA